MIQIVQADTEERLAMARNLFLEYAESLNFSLCFQDFNRELDEFPGEYAPPDGRLLIALSRTSAFGCVALRKLEEGVCEMKRLYIKPGFRGEKAGRCLAETAIRAAATIGYAVMRLDTLASMERANALYASLGFRQIPPYRHNPIEGAKYLELRLK